MNHCRAAGGAALFRITSALESSLTSRTVLTLAEYGCVALMAAELYLLPIVVGWARHVPGLRAVVVIDIMLGWTVVGWFVAVKMALRPVRGERAARSLPDEERRVAAAVGGARRQPGAAPPLEIPESRPEPDRPR